jgi:hypothetical protein
MRELECCLSGCPERAETVVVGLALCRSHIDIAFHLLGDRDTSDVSSGHLWQLLETEDWGEGEDDGR